MLECWNDPFLEPWKEVPGSGRLTTGQVKRLVLSGIIPTIQQQTVGTGPPEHTLKHTLTVQT
jgi:hypothetical protein